MSAPVRMCEPWLTPYRSALAAELAEALDLSFPQAVGGLVLLTEHDQEVYTFAQLGAVLSSCFGATHGGFEMLREHLELRDLLSRLEHGDDDDTWRVTAP